MAKVSMEANMESAVWNPPLAHSRDVDEGTVFVPAPTLNVSKLLLLMVMVWSISQYRTLASRKDLDKSSISACAPASSMLRDSMRLFKPDCMDRH